VLIKYIRVLIMSDYREEKARATRRCTKSLHALLQGYRALLEDALREEGLTLPQLRLLHAIDEQGNVSGAAIARICQITPQTLQAMLTRAVREKWIVREHPKTNQRIFTASLTHKGASLLARGTAMAAEIEARLFEGISLADIEQTNKLVDRGLANLAAELAHKSE
jgi:MarR family transcriptional regulator, organic hydroperoxide resistance regulator